MILWLVFLCAAWFYCGYVVGWNARRDAEWDSKHGFRSKGSPDAD